MTLKVLAVLKFDVIIIDNLKVIMKFRFPFRATYFSKKKSVMGKMVSYDLYVMLCCIFTES